MKQYKRSKIYTSREGNPEHRIKERETNKTDVSKTNTVLKRETIDVAVGNEIAMTIPLR